MWGNKCAHRCKQPIAILGLEDGEREALKAMNFNLVRYKIDKKEIFFRLKVINADYEQHNVE